MTVRPPYIIICQTMWKKTQWCIQIDGGKSSLAIEWCSTRYLNGADATHSLARIEHASTTFLIKKLKIQHEKYHNIPHNPSGYQKKTYVKVQKYPMMQS